MTWAQIDEASLYVLWGLGCLAALECGLSVGRSLRAWWSR